MEVDKKHMLFPHIDKASYLRIFLCPAFFLSGVSGLVYQIVWVRMLTRFLGSTTAATATVLCVFMGGLALGAFLGGRVADRIRNQILGYIVLEVGIAFIALLSSFAIITVFGSVYVDFYRFFGNNYFSLTVARVLFSMLCLLPPTVLMGATLPVLISFITRHGIHFQSGFGRLYSINTFGAVFGVLLAGFFLLGTIGEGSSLFVAALFNLLAAAIVIRLEKSLKSEAQATRTLLETEKPETVPLPFPGRIRIWSKITIFVSGFTALSYEILWTRFLTLPLKTSIYAFSFMLAQFLIGIALGSWLSTRFSLSKDKPIAAFGFIEILIGFLTVLGMLFFSILGQISDGFISRYYIGVLASVLMVLPVAIAFGWQFPIAVRCCISDTTVPGKETGRAYFLNTFGCILGSVTTGFFLLPFIGTAKAMVILGLVNILLGGILLWISPGRERGRMPAVGALLAACFVVVVFLVGNPYKMVMHKRAVRYLGPDTEMYAFFEGTAGTTVPAGVTENPFARLLFINGEGVTALVSETKLMAHLPMALVPDPKSVLVICFGMGTTVRSASRFPSHNNHIDAVDIVPKVFDSFIFFHDDAEEVKALPNIDLYAEDGRNFLLVRKTLYDVITIDPAPPIYSAGTVNLYTREFLELCKSRINKDGVVCLWLPPAAGSELIMIMKTFVNVFPGASLWGGIDSPGFYLIGGHRPFGQTEEDIKKLVKRLSAIPDLSEWQGYYKNENVLKNLYLLGPDAFSKLVKNVPEVTDDHPYTEFPLWRGVLTHNVPIMNAGFIRQNLEKLRGEINP